MSEEDLFRNRQEDHQDNKSSEALRSAPGELVFLSEDESSNHASSYPPIPNKRYFAIGEISLLCKVPQHVLRYWERFFPELKPARRRNHRYYSHQHVYLVRQIKDLVRHQGFTISGARRQLTQDTPAARSDYGKQTIRKIRQELEEILKQAKL